jgi:hypothetical protein
LLQRFQFLPVLDDDEWDFSSAEQACCAIGGRAKIAPPQPDFGSSFCAIDQANWRFPQNPMLACH